MPRNAVVGPVLSGCSARIRVYTLLRLLRQHRGADVEPFGIPERVAQRIAFRCADSASVDFAINVADRGANVEPECNSLRGSVDISVSVPVASAHWNSVDVAVIFAQRGALRDSVNVAIVGPQRKPDVVSFIKPNSVSHGAADDGRRLQRPPEV